MPGWITLGAALLFTAIGAFAEQAGYPACRLDDSCGPEPIRTLALGLLGAVIVAAFLRAAAARLIAVAFLLIFLLAGYSQVDQEWWVDAAAVVFVAVVVYVTWPGYARIPGMSGGPATFRMRVQAETRETLVRPWWLLGCVLVAVLAGGGVAGYVISESGAAADWLLVTGLAGGVAVTLGWRALDRSLARRWFLLRRQPGRECSVLPLRFEMVVVPDDGDRVLVVPSNVWEEARLQRLWADAEPDGCPATLYGVPAPGRWLAVGLAGQMIVGRAPAWAEKRDASLREAVSLIRHLADAVPDTGIADTIRHTADRYAAEVGEPDDASPGA